MVKVLVIGSGGRENALGWKLAQSEEVSEVIYAPGNAGTALENKGRNVSLDCSNPKNFPALEQLIKKEKISMTIVGPEAPLSAGVVDYFYSKRIYSVFGPTQKASLLESDKFFSYDIMHDLDIPQASSVKCSSVDSVRKAIPLLATEKGVVLKARGLTAGKGVKVCDSAEEAIREVENHAKLYGADILVCERFFGEEVSVFGISDGKQVYAMLIPFQDHKRLLDGDKGPNTGGMGAYGPAPVADKLTMNYVAEKVMKPVVEEMARRKTPYKGFLYAGMMMTSDGPRVLEFNARFGDPECQPAMMLLKSDLYSILYLAMESALGSYEIEYNPGAALCVVMASKGYPGEYKKGSKISGIELAESRYGVKVFHAGTAIKRSNGSDIVCTSGGRVLGVTAYSSEGLLSANVLAYSAITEISSEEGLHFRKDIGENALQRLQLKYAI